MLLLRKVLLLLFLSYLSSIAFAYKKSNIHAVFTLSAADAFMNTEGTTSFIQGDSLYDYGNNDTTQGRFTPGVFLGVEMPFNLSYAVQLGLSYYQPSSISYAGLLTQGVDSISYDQYPYRYSIMNRDLFIESKWLATWNKRYHPYLVLALGAAFNEFYGFDVTYPPFLTFTPLWESQTHTTFAYQLGLGVDVEINKLIRLGLGYRYFNLGNPQFDKGFIDVEPITGSLEQWVSAQVLMAQLTFIF